jgi:hypothetical protein
MTSADKSRRVEVKDGDQTVAAAEVAEHGGGTIRTSLHPPAGPAPPGSRADLVDAVMDLPEVRAGSRLEATVPLGDAESLERLRERTDDAVTRPAGSTALLDGGIPDGEDPAS